MVAIAAANHVIDKTLHHTQTRLLPMKEANSKQHKTFSHLITSAEQSADRFANPTHEVHTYTGSIRAKQKRPEDPQTLVHGPPLADSPLLPRLSPRQFYEVLGEFRFLISPTGV